MKRGKWNTFRCPEEIRYYSKRYKKWVTVPKGYPSDGATGAPDRNTRAWWVHDKLCNDGLFDDGTKCNNWQASMILFDILREDQTYDKWNRVVAPFWMISTWLIGGGKARDNGMW